MGAEGDTGLNMGSGFGSETVGGTEANVDSGGEIRCVGGGVTVFGGASSYQGGMSEVFEGVK